MPIRCFGFCIFFLIFEPKQIPHNNYTGLNWTPPTPPKKGKSMFSPLEPVNVTLFGNEVFLIKDLEMRPSWMEGTPSIQWHMSL